MTSLADLHRTVRDCLRSGRLGRPVFVRYHLDGVPVTAPGLLAVLAEWLGQTPSATFSPASTRDVVALQFADGATALISEVHGPRLQAGINLMVLGTHGALYHHDLGSPVTWQQASPASPLPPGSARYGVLLIAGSHTHQEDYAAAFAADPRCRIVAVSDEADIDPRRRELNERLARELKVPYLSELDEALARPDVAVVSICAPPERRGRIAVRCAEAGKHLYLDKSLTPTLAEADAIVAAVRRAGVRSQMFSFLTQPWALEARQLLHADGLGRLLAVHADTFFAKGLPGTAQPTIRREEYPPERHQLVEAKRELDNVGVYPITLIPWLTGQRFQRLRALTANYFFQEHQRHNVEDFGLIMGTLTDGTPVSVAAGRYGWTSHPAGGVNRLLLIGSERTLVVDAHRPRLEIYTNEPPWQPQGIHPEDPMSFWTSTQREVGVRPKQTWISILPAGSDVRSFLDCLDAGRDSELSAVEAAHAAEVLLAAYRSAAFQVEVCLPLPR